MHRHCCTMATKARERQKCLACHAVVSEWAPIDRRATRGQARQVWNASSRSAAHTAVRNRITLSLVRTPVRNVRPDDAGSVSERAACPSRAMSKSAKKEIGFRTFFSVAMIDFESVFRVLISSKGGGAHQCCCSKIVPTGCSACTAEQPTLKVTTTAAVKLVCPLVSGSSHAARGTSFWMPPLAALPALDPHRFPHFRLCVIVCVIDPPPIFPIWSMNGMRDRLRGSPSIRSRAVFPLVI
ncbi:phosphotransferase [Pseudozyma hubeiensis SY62]|uniref:Phosphotransferase n=1 Tax=Pseudozyma hubeiensis (strain SY62) TaxID=1305764 RepID=R9P0P1_PSEHS|nr:phosphotransferase [Pseudozyma hubeiensis SY62]GAC94627.1 phosphotransferase [Pseudozyma hubeiensis SY62]